MTNKQARLGLLRAAVPIPERTRFAVLEILCLACRRPYDDVANEPCIAAVNNEHLRGGPIGSRRKRSSALNLITTCVPTAAADRATG